MSINIGDYLRVFRYGLANGAPKAIENAYSLGLSAHKNYEKCYKQYPYCPYSAKTMLKLLQLYSYFMDGWSVRCLFILFLHIFSIRFSTS